jgi:hypothetical protein
LDVRFRLFRTENVWNHLLLDSQTGRLWQIQFSQSADENRMRLPINEKVLATESKLGRFTLYPTNNIWTFLLVDQDSGSVWQANFTTDLERGSRGIQLIGDESIDFDQLLGVKKR